MRAFYLERACGLCDVLRRRKATPPEACVRLDPPRDGLMFRLRPVGRKRRLSMLSGFSRRLWIITILTVVFVLFAGKSASGVTTNPAPPRMRTGRPEAVAPQLAPPSTAALAEAQARLTKGFSEILDFFAQRNFSLLAAWREMRVTGDPKLLEHKYPAISKELDAWAATLSKVDVSEAAVGRLDFTFILLSLIHI